ncbi:zinc ribbon domain-containing protein [Bacillus sp. DX1.1]|uniref:zinc ribbon domain-containing protein n=1 Tax=unclassified Bacillus (in: firmicutes) TaxID=185979 RepID=UPI002570BE67|nr:MULTISPECIES: zinc ribbon domain-containing protein [unclassified Bacillus (in: firmicutes)]MDM5153887.1 zinc ribbon domain-containing protein [Bacillus sp. DX1.1]WJE82821.1 zinc ribbon domain-containing protein [Bacillus sp. DX3.1]
MTCPNCKIENTNEAKFCGSCGHSFTEPVLATSQSAEQGEERTYEVAAPVQERRSNENVNQAKQFASGYFQFFKNALKFPTAIMKSGHIEVRNGITSLVLICFLLACTFYRMMSTTVSIATGIMSETGADFAPEATPSVFGESFKVFLFLLILFLFIGFIVFLSGKFMKSSFSFLEALGVWGTVSTPVVALLVVAFLFSFVLIFLLPLFLGFALMCMSVSTIVSILKLDRGGVDPVYTLLIAYILMTIASYIVLGAYMKMIFDTLLGGLTNF